MGTEQGTHAPAGCTLDVTGRQARVAAFAQFAATAVTGIRRPESTRLQLELRPDERAGRVAGGLAAAETACCSFFSFTLAATAGLLVLEVTVPAGREDALDTLASRMTAASPAAGSRP